MVNGILSGAAGGATVAITIKAIDEFSKSFDNATSGMQKVAASAKILGAAAATAFAAFTVSAVNAGLKMKPIEDSFRKLAKESDKFLVQLNENTKGTISNFELMANANKALLLGLDQEALPDLFKNAAIVGRAAGRTTTEAIEDITLGIGRQSRMILDNLGIIIKADDVYETFASSIGKATEDLTAQEKQIAFNRAAMDALQESANKLGGAIPEDAITDIQQLTKGYDDFSVAFGKAFIENFSVALPKASKDWMAFGKTAGDVLGVISLASLAALKVFQIGVLSFSGLLTSLIFASLKTIEVFINSIISSINKLLKGFDMVRTAMGKKTLGLEIGKVDITTRVGASLLSQADKTKSLVEDVNSLLTKVNNTTKNIANGQSNVTQEVEKQKSVVEAIQKSGVFGSELLNQGLKVIQGTGDIFNPKGFSNIDFENKWAYEQAKRGAGVQLIVEGDLIGLDPEEISRALSEQLTNKGGG